MMDATTLYPITMHDRNHVHNNFIMTDDMQDVLVPQPILKTSITTTVEPQARQGQRKSACKRPQEKVRKPVITFMSPSSSTTTTPLSSACSCVFDRLTPHNLDASTSSRDEQVSAFGENDNDFEIAGAVAKAITVIHRMFNVPLVHMKIVANPMLLCTCSFPGCTLRTKPSSFFCTEHSMLASCNNDDDVVVGKYFEKLISLGWVPQHALSNVHQDTSTNRSTNYL